MINKVKEGSNMYQFCTHTFNIIKGKCPHDCVFCYMKSFPQKEIHFDEKELKTNLGNGNIIFVGSSCDMFAESIPSCWIIVILDYCKLFNNTYIYQTKNPKRFLEFIDYFPKDTILGTTIETSRLGYEYNAPSVIERQYWIGQVDKPKFITLEPIMDFDLSILVNWIDDIKPDFVNIGADSKGHNLPEPSKEKIEELIKELQKITKINLKDNLKRLR